MSTNPSSLASALERDPVCGMNVNPATAKHVYRLGGKNYYFCCAPCLEKFKADPRQVSARAITAKVFGINYPRRRKASRALNSRSHSHAHSQSHSSARSAAGPAPAYVCPMCPEVREPKPGACPSCGMALEPDVPVASTRTEYTCPMHPEIVRPAPGSCPICGMALEPRTVTAAAEENPELRDMTRRFWVSRRAHRRRCSLIAMAAMFRVSAFTSHLNLIGVPLSAALAGIHSRHPRRPLGRMALLPAFLDFARQSQPQHVHPDRHGHRRCLRYTA